MTRVSIQDTSDLPFLHPTNPLFQCAKLQPITLTNELAHIHLTETFARTHTLGAITNTNVSS